MGNGMCRGSLNDSLASHKRHPEKRVGRLSTDPLPMSPLSHADPLEPCDEDVYESCHIQHHSFKLASHATNTLVITTGSEDEIKPDSPPVIAFGDGNEANYDALPAAVVNTGYDYAAAVQITNEIGFDYAEVTGFPQATATKEDPTNRVTTPDEYNVGLFVGQTAASTPEKHVEVVQHGGITVEQHRDITVAPESVEHRLGSHDTQRNPVSFEQPSTDTQHEIKQQQQHHHHHHQQQQQLLLLLQQPRQRQQHILQQWLLLQQPQQPHQHQQQHMSTMGYQNIHPTNLSRSNTSGKVHDKTPSYPAVVKLLFCSNDSGLLEVSSQYTFTQERWYHPGVDRRHAEIILNKYKNNAEEGLFILRNTSQDAMLCVSVVYPVLHSCQSAVEDKVFHNRIEILKNGMFRYLGTGHGSRCFRTCQELINHHHANHPRLKEIDVALTNHITESDNTNGSIRLGSYIPFVAANRTQTLVL